MKNLDILVKKAMENAEMPTPSNAWNDFEHYRVMTKGQATKSNSLVQPLIAAGVALAVTIGGINYWASQSNVGDKLTLADQHATELSDPASSGDNMVAADSFTQEDTEASSQAEVLSTDRPETSEEAALSSLIDKVTPEEKARIERINARLNRTADSVNMTDPATSEKETADNDEKKTTQYVGKGFNLGAPAVFSPNGDGRADYFMPSKLVDSSDFEMTIRDESGRVVYKTHSVDAPWSGKDMTGDTLPEGRYDWKVIVNKELKNSIFEGSVKLLRN